MSEEAVSALMDAWRAAWPQALAAWSRFTRLQDPRLCATRVEAAGEGLSGSFAMIRLVDQRVVIDLAEVTRFGLHDHAVEILAHEIGHHVLAPATASDHARLLARIRRALPTLEAHAPMVANLYTDLLINDRLQRQCGLRMAEIYQRLAAHAGPSTPGASPVWTLYMGIYEQLWQQAAGTLGGPVDDEELRGDAWLGARVIRVYAGEWMDGAGRFAALLLPRLLEQAGDARVDALMDTRQAGQGSQPAGLDRLEEDELAPVPHPSMDPRITGEAADVDQAVVQGDDAPARDGQPGAQAREPFEYGEILRAAGLDLDDHQLAVRYYRERALPHLVRYPVRPQPQALEPQIEGLEPWEPGDPLDAVDWLQSVLQSPRVVPGLTTVQRVYGLAPGREPDDEPIDLDLYVDSSGSMPDPQQRTSWLALAGAVIALSALRVGARVQATLWSGKHQYLHTGGFVRSEDEVLKVLTGYFGGATAFPIHRLRETYAQRPPQARAVHILHLSDDGITTMFDDDERGTSGWDVAADALAAARGGGTMALNLYSPLPDTLADRAAAGWTADLLRARDAGWDIHVVRDMPELLGFAQAFSRRHYQQAGTGTGR